ncbi:MAG: sulfite exporter TauE/SafE family protein [Mesorhizobium sp.]|nr:sulfite exporter TauE/SafE family protein [Mesorhizobium sp.]
MPWPQIGDRRALDILTIILLFVAGVFTGMINAVAGGGTFLSFGALTLIGVPPVVANATSSITQFPGYITSTLAYWEDFKTFWRGAIALSLASIAGALLGSWILLQLDNPQFRTLVPWLLLAATALFAAGPYLKPKPKPGQEASVGSFFGTAMQFATAIYGGFFGAGMGVMMLASLGLSQAGDYHRLNALKNMLAVVIAAVAIVVFVSGGVVAWPQAVVMIPGVALGGWSGVWVAKRVPQTVMRWIVIAVGLLLAVYYFVK